MMNSESSHEANLTSQFDGHDGSPKSGLHRRVRVALAVILAVVASALMLQRRTVTAQLAPATLTVYSNGLGAGFEDYGWTTRTIGAGKPATVDLGGWQGWIIAHPNAPIGVYTTLRLKAKLPEAAVANKIFLKLETAQGGGAAVPLDFSSFAPDANGWRSASFSTANLQPPAAFDRMTFVGQGLLPASTEVLLNDVFFEGIVSSPARFGLSAPDGTVTRQSNLDCAVGTPISPDIYGISYGNAQVGSGAEFTLGASSRRLGGNTTTRLNYDLGNAWNLASDWYYENYGAERNWTEIMNENKASGMSSAMTLPLIGWAAKDTTSSGYPVSILGAQSGFDYWRPDAGSGLSPSGTKLSTDPLRTSVAIDAATVGRWAKAVNDYATATGGTLDQVILDNEPDLWNSTHQDVHPNPLGLTELVDKTLAATSAIRAAAPQVKISGFASWGANGLLYSAADVANPGWPAVAPDRQGSGGEVHVVQYLRKLKAADALSGRRSIDYLDTHYYPQSDGVYSANIGTDVAALRIRSTRSFWDPTYADESWMKWTEIPVVNLLNRLKGWIGTAYPGTGITIGEWSFGGEAHMSGALATAETLGQFGRAGIHSAYYWTHPSADAPSAVAFRAFRNYDGNGSNFGPTSIAASSDAGAEPERLSVFGSKTADGKVVAVALNLSSTKNMTTTFNLANCGALSSYKTFTYDGSGSANLVARSAQPLTANSALLTLVPYSMTVIEFAAASVSPVCGPPAIVTSSSGAPTTTLAASTTTTPTSSTSVSSTVAPVSTSIAGGVPTVPSTTELSVPTVPVTTGLAISTTVPSLPSSSAPLDCTTVTSKLVPVAPAVTVPRQPFVPSTTSAPTVTTAPPTTTTSTIAGASSTTSLVPTTTSNPVSTVVVTVPTVPSSTTTTPATTTVPSSSIPATSTTKAPITTTTKAPVTTTTKAPVTTTKAPVTTTTKAPVTTTKKPSVTTTTKAPVTTTTKAPATTTTRAPVTTTTIPMTTVATTSATSSTTTVATTTTTTTPPAPYRFIAPASAGIGSNFPLLVTGATGGGRVDFVVDGIMPLGSVNVDSNGDAALTGAIWGPGVATIEAIWTQYVAGVPTVRTQTARIAIF